MVAEQATLAGCAAGAYLVNNARGAICDAGAVARALESGQLGGVTPPPAPAHAQHSIGGGLLLLCDAAAVRRLATWLCSWLPCMGQVVARGESESADGAGGRARQGTLGMCGRSSPRPSAANPPSTSGPAGQPAARGAPGGCLCGAP